MTYIRWTSTFWSLQTVHSLGSVKLEKMLLKGLTIIIINSIMPQIPFTFGLNLHGEVNNFKSINNIKCKKLEKIFKFGGCVLKNLQTL